MDRRFVDPGPADRLATARPGSSASGWPSSRSGSAATALVLLPSVPIAWAVPAFSLAGFGMGLAYSSFSLVVLREAQPGAEGTATAGLQLSDTLGTALGTGIAGAFVRRVGPGEVRRAPSAFGLSFAMGAAVAIAGGRPSARTFGGGGAGPDGGRPTRPRPT